MIIQPYIARMHQDDQQQRMGIIDQMECLLRLSMNWSLFLFNIPFYFVRKIILRPLFSIEKYPPHSPLNAMLVSA